ncbi:SRPBCC family protein [Daejeonella sp.]|uniref:SRPBCC family protein n=1 Tax=Daejeonella sp. TaxID=2805397 RepID=UPI002731D2E2|nr:SRPBCC family protein [Daejeonella sp.]MDP2412439.1 SRPBCC family protein [Daejeonella sp.]
MKALRIIGIILIVLAAIYFIGGQLLPTTYSVNRSIVIKAADSVVYMNVADMNNFQKWNPWLKMEPTAKVKISGPSAEPGNLWEWQGEELGTGSMELIKVNPYSSLDYELKFRQPFENSASSTFSFEKTADGINVTWSMSGESKNIDDRWMGLGMGMMMDKPFTSGLESLKELSEK